jgi:hypothetical protein
MQGVLYPTASHIARLCYHLDLNIDHYPLVVSLGHKGSILTK